ncbi:hypothetical protein BC6307_21380 [Sutcliffiella cohnii]|uniref:O-antigen ligase-related domain-containing protein n=1 Tax=Sutcliffiella cohnii TaxID=33932 RepID=A0A223KW78_9BACI|nr:O-antigen ligase family protein [Sutcliffiella cohnii]AST93633.1 hypothetical protein BC6307_21380 [Sutcliffiella cohnii]
MNIKKTKKLNTSFYSFTFIALIILLVSIYISQSVLSVIMFLAVLFLFILKDPGIGYAGWIMSYGFYYPIGEAAGMMPHFILFPIIIFTVFIQFLRRVKFSFPREILAFCIVFAIIAGASLLFSRDPNQSIIPFVLIIFALLTTTVIISSAIQDDRVLKLMNTAIVFSLIAAVLSIAIGDGLSDIGRAGLGGNVKKLANIASPALVILFIHMLFLLNKRSSLFIYKLPQKPTLLLFLLSIATLLITVSRGPILAVVVSIFFIIISSFIWQQGFFSKVKTFIIIGISLVLVTIAIPFIDTYFTNEQMNRVSLDTWGNNPRWEIWLGALSQLSSREYIFGSGLGIYRELELLSGHSYYAHSVYFDTLTTMGVAGATALFVLLIYLILFCIKTKNIYGIGLYILTIWTYATHGSITGSIEFWTFIAMVFASCYIAKTKASTT